MSVKDRIDDLICIGREKGLKPVLIVLSFEMMKEMYRNCRPTVFNIYNETGICVHTYEGIPVIPNGSLEKIRITYEVD